MKAVSSVITYFNDGLYIDEAVNSLLAQTYPIDEIIIVNDGSTDAFSIEKLKEYEQHPIVKLIHKKNGGPASARNIGFQHTKSPYILTLDADDKFGLSFVEKAIQILEQNTNVGAVSCWVEGFGEKEFIWELQGGSLENFILKNSCIACALIRKQIWEDVKGYDESLEIKGYEDWDFWIQTTKRDFQIYIIPEILYFYRQRIGSVSHKNINRHLNLYKYLLKKHPEVFEPYWSEVLDVYINQFLAQQDQIKHLENRLNMFYQSASYRLGYFLLQPLRFFQKLFRF